MGCTCKKTKCLKLYCQCFAVKIYCGGNCRCLGCCNTQAFEKERKEAIRNILARNPTAFDTKFKKTGDGQIVVDKAVPVPAPAPADRTLAHKLGCKCRKSACVKKYCECYAGGVKCSANCRCMGCKNMPIGGFGNGPPGMNGAPILPSAATAQPVQGEKTDGSPRPGWMMNAAQNLAFLKHASPATQKAKRMSIETGDMGSMPSLASEGSASPAAEGHGNGSTATTTGTGTGTSGNSNANTTSSATTSQPTMNVATATKEPPKKMEEATSSEKTAVSALLMAAVAMTEMVSNDDAETATPPAKTTSSREPMEEDFETPQKNLLHKFNSPKRKQGDREPPKMPIETGSGSTSEAQSSSGDDDSPKRDYEGNNTPHSNQQKVKRSRIGSHKKFPKTLGNDLDPKQVVSDVLASTDLSTPNTKGQFKKPDLTPVSARCIDFRNMHVNETTAAKAEN